MGSKTLPKKQICHIKFAVASEWYNYIEKIVLLVIVLLVYILVIIVTFCMLELIPDSDVPYSA